MRTMFKFIARFPKMKLIGIKHIRKFAKKGLLKLIIFCCITMDNLYTKKSKFKQFCIVSLIFAPVAQLDRALGYGPGGSGFKS